MRCFARYGDTGEELERAQMPSPAAADDEHAASASAAAAAAAAAAPFAAAPAAVAALSAAAPGAVSVGGTGGEDHAFEPSSDKNTGSVNLCACRVCMTDIERACNRRKHERCGQGTPERGDVEGFGGRASGVSSSLVRHR